MSLQVRRYKEVCRSYFERLLSKSSNFDLDMQAIISELNEKGYNSFNKHVCWWTINYGLNDWIVRIEPIYDND